MDPIFAPPIDGEGAGHSPRRTELSEAESRRAGCRMSRKKTPDTGLLL